MKKILWPLSALALAACALTPEQQAAREAAERQAQQRLAVGLAAQCSPEAAALMQRQFDGDSGKTAQERQAFRLAYAETLGEPMFRACYRLAWENYGAQQRLAAAQRREYEYWRYGPRGWGFFYW